MPLTFTPEMRVTPAACPAVSSYTAVRPLTSASVSRLPTMPPQSSPSSCFAATL